MHNFRDIVEGVPIQINKLLRYDRFSMKPCIYGKISFSLDLSIHTLFFINGLLHVIVKYNVHHKTKSES